MTTGSNPTTALTDDFDDLGDFMSELDRDLKRAAPAKSKTQKPKQAWQDLPKITPTWLPHSVTLVINTQRCRCGLQAQSVEGLFLGEMTPNGVTRERRHDKLSVPHDFATKPRVIKETTQDIDLCPCCFHAAVLQTEPPTDGLEIPGL
jgi:hypothetical protein